MSDNYEAVYNAVRSRFNGCDTSQAVESAISNAFSNMYVIPEVVRGCISEAAIEMMRPFFLLKPKVFPDGDMWCALYGENLQEGVAGFGETPAKASTQFDIEWLNSKAKKQTSSYKMPFSEPDLSFLNVRKSENLSPNIDFEAIKKEEDQIMLNEARHKGYKAENLSVGASDAERSAWNEGFNARGK